MAARAANALWKFVELIEQLDEDTRGLPLHEQTEHMIRKSGLIEHHLKEKGEKAQARIENLEELVSAARQFVGSWQRQQAELEAASDSPLTADVPLENVEVTVLAAFLDQAGCRRCPG